jgi:hypothetical protein
VLVKQNSDFKKVNSFHPAVYEGTSISEIISVPTTVLTALDKYGNIQSTSSAAAAAVFPFLSPSIPFIENDEGELTYTFFDNLSKKVKIDHDYKFSSNVLVFESD